MPDEELRVGGTRAPWRSGPGRNVRRGGCSGCSKRSWERRVGTGTARVAPPGCPVLVAGGLTHGLYACAFAVALGSSDVVYADSDARRRAIAESYGARTVENAGELDAGTFPVTVDASAHPRGLTAALRATAPGGHCHSVGIYFEPAKVPLMSMYMDAVTLTTGRPDITPHLPAVLSLLASGQVDPTRVYSDTLAHEDLPEALLGLPAKPLVLFG